MSLSIIEGKWFPYNNLSIKPVFDYMAEVHRLWNPEFRYHYEMFNTRDSFKAAFERAIMKRSHYCIYIAAHGDKNNIYGYGGESVPIGSILKLLQTTFEHGAKVEGIFFGSCLFGSHENLRKVILGSHKSLRWVAGYDYKSDLAGGTFTEASFFDDYFTLRFHDALTPLQSISRLKETNYFKNGLHLSKRKINMIYYDEKNADPCVEL